MSRYTDDPRWQRARHRKLRTQPTCERCGNPATQVHHIDGKGLDGPNAYRDTNLEALCTPCHSRHTAATTTGGWRTKPRHRPPQPHPGLL